MVWHRFGISRCAHAWRYNTESVSVGWLRSAVMNVNASRVSPVLQFFLLLLPIVFSSFFFVFAVVGFFLDGRDKVQWSVEAWEVSVLTAILIIGFNALVLILVWFRALGMRHPLALSAAGHIALSLVLTSLVAKQLA